MEDQPSQRLRIAELNREVLRELEASGSGSTIWGEWFELAADLENDHGKAAFIHHLGTQHVPSWNQNWLKGVGAELAGRLTNRPISDSLSQMRAEDASHILKKAALGLPKRKKFEKGSVNSAVRERWCMGAEFFMVTWQGDQQIAHFLHPYRFLCQ